MALYAIFFSSICQLHTTVLAAVREDVPMKKLAKIADNMSVLPSVSTVQTL